MDRWTVWSVKMRNRKSHEKQQHMEIEENDDDNSTSYNFASDYNGIIPFVNTRMRRRVLKNEITSLKYTRSLNKAQTLIQPKNIL